VGFLVTEKHGFLDRFRRAIHSCAAEVIMKCVDVDIAIVTNGVYVLICRRRDDAPLGGFWEFPGGKREPGETSEVCVIREVYEEVGIEVRPTRPLDVIEHAYPDVCVRLHPHVCEHVAGDARAIECQEVRWVEPAALRDYRFPPANDALIERLQSELILRPGSLTFIPPGD
jgi:mutator protein MutT